MLDSYNPYVRIRGLVPRDFISFILYRQTFIQLYSYTAIYYIPCMRALTIRLYVP
jgi:hypothetical protein